MTSIIIWLCELRNFINFGNDGVTRDGRGKIIQTNISWEFMWGPGWAEEDKKKLHEIQQNNPGFARLPD